MRSEPETVEQITTPALLVDRAAFDRNVASMAQTRPGSTLRPHVKAFKSTALAARLAAAGHHNFCAATVREMEGMASAGLGNDLLLANQVVDYTRLGVVAESGASVTVAVDSPETISAAAAAGLTQALIDVNVGMPRCGCAVDGAGALADLARSKGMTVRGVMGYEGHLMMVMDPGEKAERVEKSMSKLLTAHEAVGGDVVSAGGTGTYAVNRWATEIQAGSYCLLDTHYDGLGYPFEVALSVLCTVISVNKAKGWFVVDGGLKALGMDHGNPTSTRGTVMFCSDEHTTITPTDGDTPVVGERIRLLPAHVDPTVAKHRQMWVIAAEPQSQLSESAIIDRWDVDLRHW